MRRVAFTTLCLAFSGLTLGSAVWAQATQQQLDAALARLRDSLGPGTTLSYASATVLPDGHASLSEVRIVRGPGVVRIQTVDLTGTRSDGADEVLARDLRFGAQDHAGEVTLARLALHGVTLPRQLADATPRPVPFTVDSGSFEQLLVTNPDHTDMAVASGSLSGLQPGREARAELRSVEFRPHDDPSITAVRVGRIGARVSDATPLLDLLRKPRAAAVPGTQSLDAEQIALDGPGGALATADTLRAAFDQARPDAGQFTLDLDGLRPGAGARIAGTLRALGYDTVTAHLSLNAGELGGSGQDAAAAQVPARLGLQLGADGVARTGLELSLDGVPRKPGGDAMLAALGIRLVGSRLIYGDASLLGRLLAMQARQHGVSPETVREGYVRMVEQALGNGPGAAPAVASVRDALVAFLWHPGTLTVIAQPARPIPLLEIASIGTTPAAVIERLGITATARPADAATTTSPAPGVPDGKPRPAAPPSAEQPERPDAGGKPAASGTREGAEPGGAGQDGSGGPERLDGEQGGKPAPLRSPAPAITPGGKPAPD